jgi:hypothetical protein
MSYKLREDELLEPVAWSSARENRESQFIAYQGIFHRENNTHRRSTSSPHREFAGETYTALIRDIANLMH